MGCTGCGNGNAVQPGKSNGGLLIMDYIGNKKQVSVIGDETGVVYSFGISKQSFWVDHKDVVGLFQSAVGEDLRSRVQ